MPPRRDKRAMVENRNEDGESSDESRHSPSITELPETWHRPAKGTPSDDVGWCFGQPVGGNRHHIRCTLCQKLVKGGVTRFKEHIAGRRGQVTACPNISHELRIQMKAHLVETKAAKEDKKKRQEELEERLKSGGGNDYNDEDLHIAHAMRESIRERRMQEDKMRGTPGAGSSRKWSNISSPEVILRSRDPLLQRSRSSKQPRINKSWLAKTADKLGAAWSKFIIYNRLPFHVVFSPWSQPLIDVAAELGPGVKNPSPYQISEVYMEREHVEMKEWIKSFKGIWKERGVTIMCDGWISITKKHIINFLIYCNRGTVFQHSIDASDVPSRTGDYYFRLMDAVVEEIGEENVVQVVTDNEAAIKLGGKLLMEKRKHLYWIGCGAHCIDLMFEDIGKKRNVQKTLEEARVITSFIYNHSWVLDYMKKFTAGRELLRPAITRFATNFISLESISKYKTQLRNMMNSDTWKNSKWGKMRADPSYEAKKIINGSSFWQRAGDIVKVHEPLVKVLRLVDGDEKPTMGFIYEAMDQAKRAIKQDCRYWLDYWKIINNRWSFQLHHDLHAAGYFLNPQFLYSEDTSSDCYREVLKGVKKVIQRMEPDIDNQIRAINQIQMYKHQDETFGTPLAKRAIMQTNPAEWWINYGCCAPQLQPIAVKPCLLQWLIT